MGKRPRPSRRSPPTKSLNLGLPLALLLLVLLALILSVLYFVKGPGQERVAYIRLWLGLGNYGEKSEKVEEGLRAFLATKGIDPAGVKRSVSWRRKGLSSWKHFREEVPTPPSLLPRRLARELSQSLASLGGELLEEHLTPDREALEVKLGAGTVLTHSLRFEYPPDRRPAQAAIIIDDLGWDLKTARELLSIKAELTLAVLPHLAFSSRVAQEAASHNREVLLHLPMEPLAYPQKDPGPGALMSYMPGERLKELARAALESMPQARGVNNHMGSRLSESPDAMSSVMEVVGERGLFFVDSLTSPRSVAYEAAKRAGLRAAKRELFLDDEVTAEAIEAKLRELVLVAHRGGRVIAIGHPHPQTIAALRRAIPLLEEEGIEVVPVSQLVN